MNGTLPNWMERLLGLPTRPGEGTAWQLADRWDWPPWATLMLVVGAVLLVVLVYLRENPQARRRYRVALAVVRLAIIAIVLGMIAQVTVSFQRTGLPYIAVVADDSLSMTTVDQCQARVRAAIDQRLRAAGITSAASRWNLAATVLGEHDGAMLAALSDHYKLRFYFLTGVRPSHRGDVPGIVEELHAAQPSGESTQLGLAVRSVLDDLRGAAPAAIVLLTDGINTAGPSLADAAATARRKGVPLFFVGLGSDQPRRELKLSDLRVDDVVFAGDLVTFQFNVTASGYQGAKVPVTLRRQDKPEPLAKGEVTLGPDGQTQEVRLQCRLDEVGQFRFTIEAQPPDGPPQPLLHRLERTVEVRKDKIRVLLAQAYPSFEFRFLRNMLGRDETIELHTVLQDADVEYAEEDKAALRVFPVRRDELLAYDVIILGDVNPALLSAATLQNLTDFADRPGQHGSLVCLAGPKYMPQAYRDTPLARLLPFDLSNVRYPDANVPLVDGFAVRPTEIGLESPALQLGDTPEETRQLWPGLPPLYWMIDVGEVKPGARVLLERAPTHGEAHGAPLVIAQYAGVALFHTTDETYRWRQGLGDTLFARYWVQTIRWLARGKLAGGNRAARLSTDRREYHPDDRVQLRLRYADDGAAPADDDGVTVVVESQGHQTQRTKLHRREGMRGLFEGTLEHVVTGAYHAWVAVPETAGRAPAVDFRVVAPPGELAELRMEAGDMRRAAEATGGRYYDFASAQRLPDDLPEGRPVPIEPLPPLPLWNKWPVLAVFLLLLIAEWLLRKRKGMV
jgi:hypothetical protein